LVISLFPYLGNAPIRLFVNLQRSCDQVVTVDMIGECRGKNDSSQNGGLNASVSEERTITAQAPALLLQNRTTAQVLLANGDLFAIRFV
jgi:hypothetical protein